MQLQTLLFLNFSDVTLLYRFFVFTLNSLFSTPTCTFLFIYLFLKFACLDRPATSLSLVQTGGLNPHCPGSIPGDCMHQGIRQNRQATSTDIAGLKPTENNDKWKYRHSQASPTVC